MARRYITTDVYGDTYYFKDPERQILHREDGPAIECRNGDKDWFLDGENLMNEEKFLKKLKSQRKELS